MNNAELIKALREPHDWTDVSDCMRYDVWMLAAADALEAAEKRIADLETALAACRGRKGEQLPKEGEWIEDEYGYIHCSKCEMEWDEPEHPNTNYCPNCGAKMKNVTDCHTLNER